MIFPQTLFYINTSQNVIKTFYLPHSGQNRKLTYINYDLLNLSWTNWVMLNKYASVPAKNLLNANDSTSM